MHEKIYTTICGDIHYFINQKESDFQLIFLPGLTADHTLFDKQIEYFRNHFTIFTWDAPAHASSYPFELSFTLEDKARWLNEILTIEKYSHPIIIGQSMGGYVGQMYAELFPHKLCGFVSIDSTPLQKKYTNYFERLMLKHTTLMYKHYPWNLLVSTATKGLSTTVYGQKLMHTMMDVYKEDQDRYANLAGHGFKIVAEAIEKNRDYILTCPSLLICGEKDKTGSVKRYNRNWHRDTHIPLHWIKNAGHNANCDQVEEINKIIADFITSIQK